MSPKITYSDGRTPSVCIIGAGVAGLCIAIQLKRKLGLVSFTVFEKAHDVGGVWLANTYPGCQVDIPAIFYSFSFWQNPCWSQACPDRDEMWSYLQKTAKKYDIYSHTQFNTMVKSMSWNDDSKIWIVTTIADGKNVEQVHEFQIVILGTGLLRDPYYPPEFDAFTGPVMHSAEWDSTVKLENKVVGVVGCGSSAIQVIPSIAPKTKQLIVYIREPTYVFPKIQTSIPRIVQLICTIFPFLLWIIRSGGILLSEILTFMYESGSFFNKTAELLARVHLFSIVKDVNTRMMLTPRYKIGYKVPAGATKSYYKALLRSNVQLNENRISRIEGQTVITEDEKSISLDVLILCTGFKILDFFSPIQILGLHGVDLMKQWQDDRPETFYGVACSEAPNMFFLLGPNSASGHGSAIFTIECQATFIVNALSELMKKNAASIRVKLSAQTECMLEISNAVKNKVYMRDEGRTWLRNRNGHPTILWPKTSISYWLRTRRINATKFQFK